ncbi:hypothetical protein NKG94_37485 [Micromonospora sp. M12]
MVATLLRENVLAVTRPDRPAGCLSIQGGVACSTENATVAGFLATSRLTGEGALADRLARAVAEGDLPAHADPVGLARFVMIVTEGRRCMPPPESVGRTCDRRRRSPSPASPLRPGRGCPSRPSTLSERSPLEQRRPTSTSACGGRQATENVIVPV